MPAPLPPDQLTVVRNLIAKGDTAGAVKVYMEATGATAAEAQTEVNSLATRYGLVGAQVPDLFVRRTPPAPKPTAPAEEPAPPAIPPATPAPVAQQAANAPIEPAPAPAPVSPDPEAAAAAAPTPPAPMVSVPRAQASPVSTPQPSPAASTPSTQKKSRWGCSSLLVVSGGFIALAWWALS